MRLTVTSRVRNWLTACLLLLSFLPAMAWADENSPSAVRLWDTVTPLQGRPDVTQRQSWRALATAAPGHLQGDLMVETDGLLAAFASQLGEVLVSASAESPQGKASIRPAELSGKNAVIASTTVAEQNGVVLVEADFRAPGADSLPITFRFTGDRILAVRPEGSTRGITFAAPVELAVVPSLVGDDLIYECRDYPGAKTLSLPSEHFLIGLLRGENSMLVATWQEAIPSVRLELNGGAGQQSFEAITFLGGNGISLAMLDAPGIWHREILNPFFLERDVAISWRPPFPATWLTQLYEDELKTTFEFRHEKEEHWRGGIGSYTLPAWFSGEKPMLSLGKQIVPEGEAIIYFLERDNDTPEQAASPLDIADRTLADDVRAGVLEVEGRPAWWPMRPDAALGGETCNVTDVLKAIFDAGEEVQKRVFVRGGAEDMLFHLEVMFGRNERYYTFASDMIAYLDAQAKVRPGLAPYLRDLRSLPEQMIATYDNTRDTLRDMDYARELAVKTTALAAEKRPDSPQRMMELKQEWIGMGGAAEELSRREHTLARKLYQQAAYRAVGNPAAIPLAEEIRRRAKQCLRRPDSYEIWGNF